MVVMVNQPKISLSVALISPFIDIRFVKIPKTILCFHVDCMVVHLGECYRLSHTLFTPIHSRLLARYLVNNQLLILCSNHEKPDNNFWTATIPERKKNGTVFHSRLMSLRLVCCVREHVLSKMVVVSVGNVCVFTFTCFFNDVTPIGIPLKYFAFV